MKKKLLYIWEYPFSKFTSKIYFIKYFIKYFNITIIDCSNIFHRTKFISKSLLFNHSKIVYKPKTIKDLNKIINIKNPNYVILGGSSLFKDKIYNLFILKKNSVKFIDLYIYYSDIYKISPNLIFRFFIDKKFLFFIKFYISGLFNYFLNLFKFDKNKHIYKSDLVFTSGKLVYENISKKKISKNIIQTCSYEYENYFIKNVNIKNRAIFLDNLTLGHPDKGLLGIKETKINNHFYEMNDFFYFFEKKFHLPVYIAAHPKSDLKFLKKFYPNQQIIINKTKELIVSSKIVMSHSTTSSLNYAIIYNKPLIFITSLDLDNDFFYYKWLVYKNSMLKQPVINVSNPENYQKFKSVKSFKINKNGYSLFIDQFLKTKNVDNFDLKKSLLNQISILK